MHSPDMTQENIARIRELFPNCVTEARDKHGKLSLAVDFDALRQELSGSIVEGPQERYRLDWPGKREAMLAANAPIAKTLRPCSEESVDFDTTKNLFIEGDNLDALKLLQETYLGKVKMIYIDPPYNRKKGNDLIYKDDFVSSSEEYLVCSNQKDESGIRLVANNEGNGRFHSDWLSMMYSRLKISKNILADDGYILISIDHHEVNNLIMMDEIYGEASRINIIVVRRGIKNVQAQFDTLGSLSVGHEYIVLYTKKFSTKFKKLIYSAGIPRPGKWDTFWRGTNRPTMRYELFGIEPQTGQWRWEETRAREAVANYEYYLKNKTDDFTLDEWYLENLATLNIGFNFLRKNEDGVVQYYVPPTEGKLLSDNWLDITLAGSFTEEFDTEKNPDLLVRAIRWLTEPHHSDIIMDFFAGSSSTAHATLQINAEDGGNRQFIMVQLAELCEKNSAAFKAGYKNIAELSKERIRRAGKKIKEELAERQATQNSEQGSLLAESSSVSHDLDTGFRVLKVDSSNMADVFYTPDALSQHTLLDAVSNIKYDRTPEDLLFQVLLDWGVELTLPIRKETIQDKTVFFVDEDALVACFEKGITEDFVRELTAFKPLRMVFLDNGFASDAVKINAEQIFKQLSPSTEVRAL